MGEGSLGEGVVSDAWEVSVSISGHWLVGSGSIFMPRTIWISLVIRVWLDCTTDHSIDSVAAMKDHLPALRKKLNSDPVYFKKVYMHTFDLAKAVGARTLVLDNGM